MLYTCASEQENVAVAVIQDFYKCDVKFSKGFIKNNGVKNNYVALKLSGNDTLPEGVLPVRKATNAAFLYCLNTTKEDRKSYDLIKIETSYVTNNTLKTFEQNYVVEKIEAIVKQYPTVKRANDYLLQQDYVSFITLVDPKLVKEGSQERFTAYMKNRDKEVGKINRIKIIGMEPGSASNGDMVIQFFGEAERQNNQTDTFRLTALDKENNTMLYSFNYN